MEEYVKWLENKIELCVEDKDLRREHWAFCQALKKYRESTSTVPAPLSQNEKLKSFAKTYDVKEVFDRYTETKELKEADIFHLYDTGEECIKDNSGYHDSRHFELTVFNTETMQKRNCGRHDSITSLSNDLPIQMMRVYADGSFFVKLGRLAKIELFQNVMLS